MYHQVEVHKACVAGADAEKKVYWLWVNRELRTGEGVIIMEEGEDQYWIVDRTFTSLKELDTLPKRVRLGHIQSRGNEDERRD